MKALVVYCHPKEESFTAAVRDLILAKLEAQRAEVRVIDLYSRAFSPVLTAGELETYLDPGRNTEVVSQDVADLKWCDTLIFVYPTWWYGLPAMLKGWLDRVFVPETAFLMPGKRTLFRGVGFLCAKPLKTAFAAHYLMDSSTPESRKAHLDRVARKMDRFLS